MADSAELHHASQLETAEPVVDGAEVREQQQQDRASHETIVATIKQSNDPRLRSLSNFLSGKDSLSPQQLFELLVADENVSAAFAAYLQAPDKAAFWQTEAGGQLSQALNQAESIIDVPAGPAEATPEQNEHVAEATAAWEIIKDKCDPACPDHLESVIINKLAVLAERVDLVELTIAREDQVIANVQNLIMEALADDKRRRDLAKESQQKKQESILEQAEVEKVAATKDNVEAKEDNTEATENNVEAAEARVNELKQKDNLDLSEINELLNLKDNKGESIWKKYKGQPEYDDMYATLSALRTRISGAMSVINPETDPKAAAAVTQIFQSSSFNWKAEAGPAQFTGVLDQIEASGELSRDQKDAIATQLGVPPTDTNTGTKIQNAIDQGRGTNPETGQPIPYTKDQPLKLDSDTTVYTQPDGTRTAEVNVNGRTFSTNFDRNTSGAKVGQLTYTLRMIYATEKLNLAEPLFQRGYKITQGGGEIDLHYDDIITAQRLGRIFVGGETGYDGTIMEESVINGLEHRFQALNSKGDETSWVNDPEASTRDLQGLGVLTPDGGINWTQFEAIADYLLVLESKGGKPDYQLLLERFGEPGDGEVSG